MPDGALGLRIALLALLATAAHAVCDTSRISFTEATSLSCKVSNDLAVLNSSHLLGVGQVSGNSLRACAELVPVSSSDPSFVVFNATTGTSFFSSAIGFGAGGSAIVTGMSNTTLRTGVARSAPEGVVLLLNGTSIEWDVYLNNGSVTIVLDAAVDTALGAVFAVELSESGGGVVGSLVRLALSNGALVYRARIGSRYEAPLLSSLTDFRLTSVLTIASTRVLVSTVDSVVYVATSMKDDVENARPRTGAMMLVAVKKSDAAVLFESFINGIASELVVGATLSVDSSQVLVVGLTDSPSVFLQDDKKREIAFGSDFTLKPFYAFFDSRSGRILAVRPIKLSRSSNSEVRASGVARSITGDYVIPLSLQSANSVALATIMDRDTGIIHYPPALSVGSPSNSDPVIFDSFVALASYSNSDAKLLVWDLKREMGRSDLYNLGPAGGVFGASSTGASALYAVTVDRSTGIVYAAGTVRGSLSGASPAVGGSDVLLSIGRPDDGGNAVSFASLPLAFAEEAHAIALVFPGPAIFVAGTVNPSFKLDTDWLVALVDVNGTMLSSISSPAAITTGSDDQVNAAAASAVLPRIVWVAGFWNGSQGMLAQFNTSGDSLALRSTFDLGDVFTSIVDIAEAPAGSLVMCGGSSSGSREARVAKFTAAVSRRAFEWQFVLEMETDVEFSKLALLETGDVIVVGSSRSDPVTRKALELTSGFALQLSPQGILRWSRSFSQEVTTRATSIALASPGIAVVAVRISAEDGEPEATVVATLGAVGLLESFTVFDPGCGHVDVNAIGARTDGRVVLAGKVSGLLSQTDITVSRSAGLLYFPQTPTSFLEGLMERASSILAATNVTSLSLLNDMAVVSFGTRIALYAGVAGGFEFAGQVVASSDVLFIDRQPLGSSPHLVVGLANNTLVVLAGNLPARLLPMSLTLPVDTALYAVRSASASRAFVVYAAPGGSLTVARIHINSSALRIDATGVLNASHNISQRALLACDVWSDIDSRFYVAVGARLTAYHAISFAPIASTVLNGSVRALDVMSRGEVAVAAGSVLAVYVLPEGSSAFTLKWRVSFASNITDMSTSPLGNAVFCVAGSSIAGFTSFGARLLTNGLPAVTLANAKLIAGTSGNRVIAVSESSGQPLLHSSLFAAPISDRLAESSRTSTVDLVSTGVARIGAMAIDPSGDFVHLFGISIVDSANILTTSQPIISILRGSDLALLSSRALPTLGSIVGFQFDVIMPLESERYLLVGSVGKEAFLSDVSGEGFVALVNYSAASVERRFNFSVASNTDQRLYSAVRGASGAFYVAGFSTAQSVDTTTPRTNLTLSYSGSPADYRRADAYLVALSADLQERWSLQLGTLMHDLPFGVAVGAGVNETSAYLYGKSEAAVYLNNGAGGPITRTGFFDGQNVSLHSSARAFGWITRRSAATGARLATALFANYDTIVALTIATFDSGPALMVLAALQPHLIDPCPECQGLYLLTLNPSTLALQLSMPIQGQASVGDGWQRRLFTLSFLDKSQEMFATMPTTPLANTNSEVVVATYAIMDPTGKSPIRKRGITILAQEARRQPVVQRTRSGRIYALDLGSRISQGREAISSMVRFFDPPRQCDTCRHGVCSLHRGVTEYYCECFPGYHGANCEEPAGKPFALRLDGVPMVIAATQQRVLNALTGDILGLSPGLQLVVPQGNATLGSINSTTFACSVSRSLSVTCSGGPLTSAGGITQMACAVYGCCWVTTTGEVRCYSNEFSFSQRYPFPPLDVLGSPVAKMDMFSETLCVLHSSGRSLCWNRDRPENYVELTSGATGSRASDVAAGYFYGCAVVFGRVVCRSLPGYVNSTGAAEPPATLEAAKRVVCGFTHACALAEETFGGVQCWGASQSAFGSLGSTDPITAMSQIVGGVMCVLYVSALSCFDVSNGTALVSATPPVGDSFVLRGSTDYYVSDQGRDVSGCGFTPSTACATVNFLQGSQEMGESLTTVWLDGLQRVVGTLDLRAVHFMDAGFGLAPRATLQCESVGGAGISICFKISSPLIRIKGINFFRSAIRVSVSQDVLFETCTFSQTPARVSASLAIESSTVMLYDVAVIDTRTTAVVATNSAVFIEGSRFLRNTVDGVGGGVFALASDLVIRFSFFAENSATRLGGALYLQSSQRLDLVDVAFEDNVAQSGGALYITGTSDSRLRRLRFSRNVALGSGGAIELVAGVLSLEESVLESNQAESGDGGAVKVESGMIAMRHVLLANNSAMNGGAVRCVGQRELPGVVEVINSRVVGNLARSFIQDSAQSSTGGGAISMSECSFFAVRAVFAQNSAIRGGALVSNSLATSFMHDCSFFNNSAIVGSGGALAIANSELIMCGENAFASNSATRDSTRGAAVAGGGAVAVVNSVVSPRTCAGAPGARSLFERNIASLGAGGAVLYQSSDLALVFGNGTKTTVIDNAAVYGATVATPSFALQFESTAPFEANQTSGEPLQPAVCVLLVDGQGALVTLDSATFVRASLVPGNETGTLRGVLSAQMLNGRACFADDTGSALRLSGLVGSGPTYVISFFTAVLQLDGSQRQVEVFGAVRFRPCAPGEALAQVDGGEVCALCPVGRFSNVSGAATCTACPAGTFSNVVNATRCELCSPGTSQNLPGQVTCTQCPQGRYSSTSGSSNCTLCEAGRFQGGFGFSTCSNCSAGQSAEADRVSCSPCGQGRAALSGEPACSSCVPGKFAAAGASVCSDCEPGRHNDADGSSSCVLCVPGKSQPQAGQTSCHVCEANSEAPFEGLANCTRCLEGSFTPTSSNASDHIKCQSCRAPSEYALVSPSGSVRCVPCPPNAACANTRVIPAEGYWFAGGDESASTLRCLPNYCANGSCTANRKPASENPLCGECLEGFYQWGDDCIACDGTRWDIIILLLLALFALVVIFHVISQKTTGEMKVFMYFVQTSLLLVGGDNALVLYVFEIFNFDIFGTTGGILCVAPLSQFQRLMLDFIPPAVAYVHLLLLTLGAFVMHLCRRGSRNEERGRAHSMQPPRPMPSLESQVELVDGPSSMSSRTVMGAEMGAANDTGGSTSFHWRPFGRTFFALYLFTFNALCQACFSFFYCVEVPMPSGTVRVVQPFPAVSCDSDSYKTALPFVIILSVLEMLVAPAVLFAILYSSVRSGRFKEPHFESLFGILYRVYKEPFYFWQIFALTRRTVLVAAVVFLAKLRGTRFALLSALNLVFLLLQVRFAPFVSKMENLFEVVSLVLLCGISFIMPSLDDPPTVRQQLLLFFLSFVPACAFLVWVVQRKGRRLHRTFRERKQRLASAQTLAIGEPHVF